MPSVRTVERNIGNLEGFDVTMRDKDGKDMRSDKNGLPSFSFERGAKGDMTVSEWKEKRFKQTYPGYECDVLNGDGEAVAGNTNVDISA